MPLSSDALSPDALLEDLARPGELLIVQDLDGVCMELVHDPRHRRLDPAYLRASRRLEGQFAVLTNGEHEGSRGVNRVVEAALAGQTDPAAEGLYLPGLAAGGVQLQDRFARVSHPGVSTGEIAFLAAAVDQLRGALLERLPALLPQLDAQERAAQVEAAVLDNPLSPSLNLNGLFAAVEGDVGRQQDLQQLALELMGHLLEQAAGAGLGEAFFLHLAPNLGSRGGSEQLKPASAGATGTTDFQLMLRGALKEVGLLVLINQAIARRTGSAPLGADFNVRTAPHDHPSLLELARSAIPPALMPRLVGVGDTITSMPAPGGEGWLRGGSDRGFLTLLQELGEVFGTANRVVLVDSSGGAVDRPSHGDGTLAGLTDPEDPLRIDASLPGGPQQYVRLFQELAERRS
ncbi:glucosylglycerol 3-phosphatase [Cyanobium sp. PCC 7001]|uniref:glucosylglycerol 3-phosphatase n=1 Tax=Cyanobium sp. PCC 7001 TaxID=180281 RepID=UPI0001805850|nr:glucosylglycerol 3-phosphatase [Cyanobium sp. PCC 7001]EDY39630.1 glucosylglycerol 3-phosphatase [Cyanobium sp. PCC 7001]